MKEPELIHISPEDIVPSPFQVRKHFDPNYINEIGQSIKQRGMLQPISVRKVGDRYELIVGECRWRGSVGAGVERIPALLREMTDDDAREAVLVENLQRSDLSIMEEARGYHDMLMLRDEDGKARYTVEKIAEKIGKERSYIAQRLSLLRLTDEAINALQSGLISFSVARQLARVPGEKHRAEATKRVLHPPHQDVPLNARQTSELLATEFMRELKGAPFDREDAALVPIALDAAGERCRGGACSDCPFRTGNMPEYAGVGSSGNRGDVCTHLECYNAKVDAAWSRVSEEAAKDGKKVLSQEECEKLYPWVHYPTELTHSTPLVDISTQVPGELLIDPNQKRKPSWKHMLKGVKNAPQIVVARDRKGGVHEFVDRQQAIEALKLDAKEKNIPCAIRDASSRRSGASNVSAAERAERERRAVGLEVAHRATAKLVDAIAELFKRSGASEAHMPFWEAMREIAFELAGADGIWMVGKRIGAEADKGEYSTGGRAFEKGIRKMWSGLPAHRLPAQVAELLMARQLKWSGVEYKAFSTLAKAFEIDIKAIEKQVKADRAEKKKAQPKAEKKKAAEKPAHAKRVSNQGLKDLKERILKLLDEAGGEGLTIKELSEKTALPPATLVAWFSISGSKISEIINTGFAQYAHIKHVGKAGKPDKEKLAKVRVATVKTSKAGKAGAK